MGGTGLMFLFCLGVLAVLMVQGYPVAGVTPGLSGSDGEPVFCRRSGHDPSLEKAEKKDREPFPNGRMGRQKRKRLQERRRLERRNRAESWKESQEEIREETWKVNQEEIREEEWKESQTDIPAEPEHESGCGKEGGQYA